VPGSTRRSARTSCDTPAAATSLTPEPVSIFGGPAPATRASRPVTHEGGLRRETREPSYCGRYGGIYADAHTGCANCGTPTGRGGTLRGPDRAWWSCCQACTDLVVDQMEVVDDRPDGCPIIGLYHNPPERAVVLAVGRTGGSVSSLEVPRRSEGSPAMTFLRRLQPEQSDRALHGQRDHMNRASAGFDHGSNT
jgi:hypothetical protein